jgi:hypothetical protein
MKLTKVISVQKRMDGRLFVLLPKVIVELLDIRPQTKLEIALTGKELRVRKVPDTSTRG